MRTRTWPTSTHCCRAAHPWVIATDLDSSHANLRRFVMLTVRDVVLSLVFFGVAFIGTLLITATLMLAIKPKGRAAADLDKREGFEP